MKKILYTLCFSLFALSSHAHAQEEDVASISGKVLDSSTGAVIEEASVELFLDSAARYQSSTNSSGEYSFDQIRPGEYTLVVCAPEYTSVALKVEAIAGKALSQNIAISQGNQDAIDSNEEEVVDQKYSNNATEVDE